MRVWMTGENGFISRAFVRHLGHKYTIENSHLNNNYDYWRQLKFKPYHHKEINIFDPTLKTIIERADIDCIIHTATNILHKDYELMIKQNVEGSYYIAQIAKDLNIPVILIQYDNHTNNKFMWTQRATTDLFRTMGVPFVHVITDELFGPEDFYGSISQLLMSSVGKIEEANFTADLNNPTHYTFIDDFLDGLSEVIDNLDVYKNKSVTIKNPEMRTIDKVIDYMSETMEITLQYNIYENEAENYSELSEGSLKNWQCKYPFEEALVITRDMIYERTRIRNY